MPRSSPTISTLQPGEVIRLDLKGRKRSGIYAFHGRIVAVDDHAIRLDRVTSMATYDLSLPVASRVAGPVAIPWSSVLTVRVEVTG